MPNPLENLLLLQYLSGAGSAISAGQPIGPAVNEVTQQNISARNYMKILQRMLGGSFQEGEKMTMDSKGMKINVPSQSVNVSPNAQDPTTQARAGSLVQSPTQTGISPQQLQQLMAMFLMMGGGGAGGINPSSSPLGNLSGADLAGLTPQDISQALRLKLGSEALEQQKRTDLVDMMYKSALMRKALVPGEADARDLPFVKGVPGYGDLTLRQYSALAPKDREYASYVLATRELGREPMSKSDWEKTDNKDKLPTTAMGAAIADYYEQHRKLPPPEILKQWTEMFSETQEPKPTPVNWKNAADYVEHRFGHQDPTGRWVVTPELQGAHRRAQEILTDLKAQGVDPLVAVNEAETRARSEFKGIERRYFEYLKLAGGDQSKIDKLKSQFYRQYGYIPIEGKY